MIHILEALGACGHLALAWDGTEVGLAGCR